MKDNTLRYLYPPLSGGRFFPLMRRSRYPFEEPLPYFSIFDPLDTFPYVANAAAIDRHGERGGFAVDFGATSIETAGPRDVR